MKELFSKILWYFNPRPNHDPSVPQNLNLRFMHGINRISLLMFLGALIFLGIRAMLR